jgi:hypothetical protein
MEYKLQGPGHYKRFSSLTPRHLRFFSYYCDNFIENVLATQHFPNCGLAQCDHPLGHCRPPDKFGVRPSRMIEQRKSIINFVIGLQYDSAFF